MIYQKTIKIPIHYGTTKEKLDKLNTLTARITYAIRLISALIVEDIKLDRKTLRELVRNSDVVEKTGLSAGFIDQCVDKVIWSWKSHKKLHKAWAKQVERVEQTGKDKWLAKLKKREPSPPAFDSHKISCQIDVRTGQRWRRKMSKKLRSGEA